jgi:hypothetical protein
MSSGRGRSPCDTGPRELRLDVICPGTLAAASRRNDGSGGTRDRKAAPKRAAITRDISRWGIAPMCQSGAPTASRGRPIRRSPSCRGLGRLSPIT